MGVRKFGPFVYQHQKIGPFFYLLFKKGVYFIPGGAEKGGYSACTSILCHMKVVTPRPDQGLHCLLPEYSIQIRIKI